MEKNKIFRSAWGAEVLFWLAVFVLLTISNAAFDLVLSVEQSAFLTLGMLSVSLVSHFLLLPRLYERTLLLLASSVALVALMAWGSSFALDALESHYFAADVAEHSPLDIVLPSEEKRFFEEVDARGGSRISLTSGWKAFILYMCAFLFSLIMFYRRRTKEIEEQRSLLLQEKVRMELNFLRSQINPHFLFNALNNIYSMIYTGDAHAADCVLTLSEMLRYVTYESKEDRIPLSGEISYLENYIGFQRFSFEDNIDVSFEKQVEDDQIQIAPMLLQPFVENAFKHSGIGQKPGAFIHIRLVANHERLVFDIENSLKTKSADAKQKCGIGVQNVRKRLDLLYSNRFSLNLTEDSAVYKLNLAIELGDKG